MSARRRAGEERLYYSPPAMRRYKYNQQQQQPKLNSSYSALPEKREFRSGSYLDRFLEHTTPVVAAQHFPRTSMRAWRNRSSEFHPYFILGDLWESFREWSVYGVGVPLLWSDSVVQYYVPSLSGIQLYIDPTRHVREQRMKEVHLAVIGWLQCLVSHLVVTGAEVLFFCPVIHPRRPGEESDATSSRETSSDGDSECGTDRGANSNQGSWSQKNTIDQGYSRFAGRNNPLMESSIDGDDISNPPDLYWLAFKQMSILASRFPQLKTYRSCDLTPSSWISVAWYPIYRIPIGPTLQNVDASFLTFHSLAKPVRNSESMQNADSKLSLPIFGLVPYKFKVSDSDGDGVYERQKVNSLLRAADNWLRVVQVDHPDYNFFMSHNTFWR
ncbi:hypothetical protein Sango_0557200 [Sesamum angolense]|uniref:Uncharacterized protein n=1 Tax=Sesamum angolense TaxID=2727404 RepID=A0AAE1X615_9LAMI|nr:hypothetical protein Sango_0557200 [Sesamum angolense]